MSSAASSSSREGTPDGDAAPRGAAAEKDVAPAAPEENLISREPPDFTGPSGFRRTDYGDIAASEFDLDDLDDDDFELILIRAPVNVKAKHLAGLLVPETGSSTSFKARKQAYVLGDADVKGDMESMTAFLPSKAEDNKLFRAKKPFARRLAVTLAGKTDGPEDNIEAAPLSVRDRHKQPKMKYHFDCFGQGHDGEGLEAEDQAPPTKKRKH